MPESARAGRKETRAEVILSSLPSRSSNAYIQLLRLAGKDMRVQNIDLHPTVVLAKWPSHRSRVSRGATCEAARAGCLERRDAAF
jgi:hypothetical protein